jgi:RNA polymerase sigma-70 factor (ECF subfamily)
MLPQTPDAALMEAMAKGDESALGSLYDRHSALLHAVALRLLADKSEAEDLVHDVFLEAWRYAADYDPRRAPVRTWLLLRLRSRALDRLRSARMTRTEALEDEQRPEPPAQQPGADDLSDHMRARAALEGLSSEQRMVIELSCYSGRSAADIARELDIPIGTVKSRLAGALKKMRAALGADQGVSP